MSDFEEKGTVYDIKWGDNSVIDTSDLYRFGTMTDDDGNYRNMLGMNVTYVDKNGFVKDMNRFAIDKFSDSPRLEGEAMYVKPDDFDDDYQFITYESLNPAVDVSRLIDKVKRETCFFSVGKYAVLHFMFSEKQVNVANRMFDILDDWYKEKEKVEKHGNLNTAMLPIMSIVCSPLFSGGKLGAYMANPELWQLMDREKDFDKKPGCVLMVVSRMDNFRFLSWPDIDVEDIEKKYKAGLMSEYINERHIAFVKQREEEYKNERSRDIIVHTKPKHTFMSSVLDIFR